MKLSLNLIKIKLQINHEIEAFAILGCFAFSYLIITKIIRALGQLQK